jgi:hypothetical protein
MPPLREQGRRLGFPYLEPLPLGYQGFQFGPLGLIECSLGVCLHEHVHTRLLVLTHLFTRQRPSRLIREMDERFQFALLIRG